MLSPAFTWFGPTISNLKSGVGFGRDGGCVFVGKSVAVLTQTVVDLVDDVPGFVVLFAGVVVVIAAGGLETAGWFVFAAVVDTKALTDRSVGAFVSSGMTAS